MNAGQDSAPYAHLEELLIESRTRPLTPPEREELNAALRHDAGARRHAADFLLDDAALTEELRATQVEALLAGDAAGVSPDPSTIEAPASRRARAPWPTLASLAAGIVLGLFCASMVWAYAVPRVIALVDRVVPVADGDFEIGAEPLADGMPRRFGVWSGGNTRVVEGEQGIQPQSGNRMLRILRSDANADRPVADIMQLIDLRPFKAEIASGTAVLEVSASANTSVTENDRFRFGVRAFAFAGHPEALASDGREILQSALASARHGFVLDAKSAKWQKAAARLLVPAEADFAMIKLTLSQKDSESATPVEFAGHYVDDVKLVLKVQPSSVIRPSRKATRTR